MRILYGPKNLAELFSVDLKTIHLWTRLGILPVFEESTALMYDKKDIDVWLAAGNLERHKAQRLAERSKGVYGFHRRERGTPLITSK